MAEIKLEVGKTYRSKGGVIWYCGTETKYNKRHDFIMESNAGDCSYFTSDGFYFHDKRNDMYNIIEEVVPTKEVKGWMNIYKSLNGKGYAGDFIYKTKEDAEFVETDRIDCIEVTINVPVGDEE